MEKSDKWTVKRQADIAVFFDQSIETVKGWAKQGMPGQSGDYDVSAIVQWLRQSGPWRQHHRQIEDDPDLAITGGDSPNLERYRAAKAAIAELDYAERQKELIARDKVKSLFARWASVLRRMGERISKRFGNEAALTVNDSLRECGEIITYELGGDGATESTAD